LKAGLQNSRWYRPTNMLNRIQSLAREWHLTVADSFETETSVISSVTRDHQSLVLKVIKRECR